MGTLYFCTLFNSAYFLRGLALYESLINTCKDFKLYVIAFDNDTYEALSFLKLEHLIPISLFEFEDEILLKLKSERTFQEYCWTCTPFTIHYCMEKYKLSHCTYLDADTYYFSDPKILFNSVDLENTSVIISPHRFTEKYDLSTTSGIYCVQFLTIFDNIRGRGILNWWKDRCEEWCYARFEDGKFGDQKYLDSWPTQFKDVYVLPQLGAGVAPWNCQQYFFQKNGAKLQGIEYRTNVQFEVIFYHFHDFKFFEDGGWGHKSEYFISDQVYNYFYKSYLIHLFNLSKRSYEKINNFEKINPPKYMSEFVGLEFVYNDCLDYLDQNKILNNYFKRENFILKDDYGIDLVEKFIFYGFNLKTKYFIINQIPSLLDIKEVNLGKRVSSSIFLGTDRKYNFKNNISQFVEISGDWLDFTVIFPLNVIEKVDSVYWLVAFRFSCELDCLEFFYKDNNGKYILIDNSFVATNGIPKNGRISFYHSHPIIEWNQLNLLTNEIKIVGKWRVIDTWDAYTGMNNIIEDLKERNRKLEEQVNSNFFRKIFQLVKRFIKLLV